MGWLDLAAKAPAQRRVALILSAYPGKDWNMGHAIGLDAPQSARMICEDLAAAGYDTGAGGLPSGEALRHGSPRARRAGPWQSTRAH